MSLAEQRHKIRHLLNEEDPADAMAAYFALYHPENKTTLRPYPPDAARAEGYVCLSRTGIDLFRPFVTMRLPIHHIEASAAVIYAALEPGMPLILNVPESYSPLINALFAVQMEERLQLFDLRVNQAAPIINVLVTQDIGANRLPRFIIRDRQNENVLVASAGLNWQTTRFAEISVNTHPQYRRQGYGRSVVAAMAEYLLANGRTPLYVASEQNYASTQLARRLGFSDTLDRKLMIQGYLKTGQY